MRGESLGPGLCEARTKSRNGAPCRRKAVLGATRCYLHGGRYIPGAPKSPEAIARIRRAQWIRWRTKAHTNGEPPKYAESLAFCPPLAAFMPGVDPHTWRYPPPINPPPPPGGHEDLSSARGPDNFWTLSHFLCGNVVDAIGDWESEGGMWLRSGID